MAVADPGPDSAEAAARPRLLLVPMLTELEWRIKPLLEEWAEVASFDAPGVGDEPGVDEFGPEAVAARGLDEIDRRGWGSCVVVADEFGVVAAVEIAHRRPDAVGALALGHARISNSTDRERPALHPEILDALGHLARNDHRTYVRQMFKLSQGELVKGGYDDEIVDAYLERVPSELVVRLLEGTPAAGARIRAQLEAVDAPLLLARHERCILFTEEGFEDAVAALPTAHTATLGEKPSASPEFVTVLEAFCSDLPQQ
jgi:hypothetical protein